MNEIIDKIILFLCCTTLFLFHISGNFFIVPVIISIVLTSLFVYYDRDKLRLIGVLFFALLCIFFPIYIVFLPLLLYDILHTRYQYVLFTVPALFLYHLFAYNSMIISFTSAFLVLAFLLKYKTNRLNTITGEYNDLRDSSAHMSLLLEEKNSDLLKNQDYEINVATLNERNRISKEIHDNIGHLLSRALLQVGALQVLTREESTGEGLSALKESLSVGMDQIRSSIHNMFDESVDLYMQIDGLVKDFTFCAITYDYDIKNPPPLPLKYSLIAITREAFANIMRHSNATKVNITLREHPAMYQLVIQDNGTIDAKTHKVLTKLMEDQGFNEGMGLRNIYDRVKSFDGNVNITLEHGFRLFLSIPKCVSTNEEVVV
jgi:signal transduction histidine kinase